MFIFLLGNHQSLYVSAHVFLKAVSFLFYLESRDIRNRNKLACTRNMLESLPVSNLTFHAMSHTSFFFSILLVLFCLFLWMPGPWSFRWSYRYVYVCCDGDVRKFKCVCEYLLSCLFGLLCLWHSGDVEGVDIVGLPAICELQREWMFLYFYSWYCYILLRSLCSSFIIWVGLRLPSKNDKFCLWT